MRDLNRLWRPALCAVALVAPFVGCSGTDAPLNPSTDPGTDTSGVLDINDPDGGFDTAREAPGFGEGFLTDGEAEMAVEDAIAEDPAVLDMLDDPDRYNVYGVRVTWGYLKRSETNVSDPLDWSGAAKIADGVLLGVRAISFERRQGDRVLRPRVSRTEIGWESTTTTAFDGIQLMVIDPNFSDIANALVVDMPLFSEAFAVPLDGPLDQVFDIDDVGHQVRVQIQRREPGGDCRRGWVSGQWNHRPLAVTAVDGASGTFMGNMSNVAGDQLAAIKGYYGVNAEGHRVLFGKVIDRDGNFRALVRGTWMPSPDTPGAGSFRAGLIGGERLRIGSMRGVYQARDDVVGGGFFHGSWNTRCDTDDTPNDGDGDDEEDPTTGDGGR